MISIMSKCFFDHLRALPHHIRCFENGGLIFERDEPVISYFSVRSGTAVLHRNQIDGTAVILQQANAGSVLAEASLNSAFYHCSARAISMAELFVFDVQAVQEILRLNADASRAYVDHLASEIQNARRRAEILSLKRVSERLDAWLVWHDGVLPRKGDWHLLADEIGVSDAALYRELAKRP